MDGWFHHVVPWALFAYLLGSIPIGVVLGWLRGVDLRLLGSGNIGATNAIRALGPRLGVLVLILDVGKATLPVALAQQDFALGPDRPYSVAIVALAAVLGHIFSVYLRFRGGKGVACALGVFLAIDPALALGGLIIYGQTLVLTRTSAIGSLTAVTSMTLAVAIADRPLAYQLLCGAVALIIWARHIDNVRELIADAKRRQRSKSAPA